ncbi:hypothetical protein [Candidatus Amarolinea dominans]|uniref:hypothetical protein n=1 Tax=Candidatus Amarolinea dominans TaxID=3140696 RepID=UPI0031CC97D0
MKLTEQIVNDGHVDERTQLTQTVTQLLKGLVRFLIIAKAGIILSLMVGLHAQGVGGTGV